MPDEVVFVPAQDDAGVLLVVDQDPIGALRPDAANEAFCDCVRPRRPRRSFDHVDAFGRKHGVEGLGLRAQERTPPGVNVARRWADPGSGEDTADGAGADPVAEADQFSLDASVPQPGVLPGQARDEVSDLVADRWASRPVWRRPVPADQTAVPGQQRGRGDDAMLPQFAR
jgi:hypothetical protein